jgi:hydrogenase-4 component F
MKITFVLIFIGYGTKFGLVPMHTWLPDAHSQAPTPVSALLSGVLLNCALYGILRYHIITIQVLGVGFSGSLFLIFGLLSLIVAMFFILIVKDYKRLLAYHSIEHMGIIAIGFGIGGPIAIFGALFHVMNHSYTKSLLFFGGGNILQKYGTREIEQVKGVGKVMPATAIFFMMGMFALTGCPPFSIFASEITIINGMILQQDYIIAGVFIAALVAIFAGFVNHAGVMVFGEPLLIAQSPTVGNLAPDTAGKIIQKESKVLPVARGEFSKTSLVVMAVLVFAILYLGVALPTWFSGMLNGIVKMF